MTSSLEASASELTPLAKIALILECENEIKTLERELREVEVLEQRGVVGAGDLQSMSSRLVFYESSLISLDIRRARSVATGT